MPSLSTFLSYFLSIPGLKHLPLSLSSSVSSQLSVRFKRSFSDCLLAQRTTVTFIHNLRANSRVMINHLGEDEFLVSLNLKAMLQLIKISPLAFTKATKMRQNPNKPVRGVSYWLQSICTYQPLYPSQTVLNTVFFLCLDVTKNNPLQENISV